MECHQQELEETDVESDLWSIDVQCLKPFPRLTSPSQQRPFVVNDAGTAILSTTE